jgi:predicted ribosome quality control (RQC) complex YloA/Tae2 family protein
MIQYYLDLKKQVKVINDQRLNYGQIQKIYSTAFYICFSIRTPGKTWFLFFGRGNGYEGIWLDDSAPVAALRRKDNFLEYLRKHISSCSFLDLELDTFDRIVRLSYQKFGNKQSFYFFWKARKLYFIHHFMDQPESPFKLLLSWTGKAIMLNEEIESSYEFFDEVGRRQDMLHDLSSKEIISIKQLLEDEYNLSKIKTIASNPTFLHRKINNIEQDLNKAMQWKRLQEYLDQEHPLDTYELKIGDQKIKLAGDLNPYEKRNLLFQKIKKLKRGEAILTERLMSAKKQLDGKEAAPVEKSQLAINKPIWGKEEKKEAVNSISAVNDKDIKVFKFDQFSVGVGLNTSGNDQLRNTWASREDLWLHLDGIKSAHVIIKFHQLVGLTPEILNLAASILAHFSHFLDPWVPIIYTQVKNLKGVAGAAGMVTFKKEKHLRCLAADKKLWLKE